MSTFLPSDILIPQVDSMKKWAVIACDQYSSQPEYWEEVKEIVKDAPSALQLIFPEAELGTEGEKARIKSIQNAMNQYMQNDILKQYKNSFVYVERTLQNGKIRRGIVGIVDLEQYSYTPEHEANIRATEKTVIERIPPRMNIRIQASMELPHVILLCDDRKKELLASITEIKDQFPKLYEFDLMQNGGHIAGWLIEGDAAGEFTKKLKQYEEETKIRYQDLSDQPMLYAVGDGNHSLAAAKACYEKLKRNHEGEDLSVHPARYALVELENLHDEAQEFEPIHRIVKDTDWEELLTQLKEQCCEEDGFPIQWCAGNKEETIYLNLHKNQLAVDRLQTFLDKYLKENSGEIDYIHGEDVVRKLAAEDHAIGFLLPAMGKDQLFPSVMTDGTLPRKTFSMGHACEKRYYIEGRKIR